MAAETTLHLGEQALAVVVQAFAAPAARVVKTFQQQVFDRTATHAVGHRQGIALTHVFAIGVFVTGATVEGLKCADGERVGGELRPASRTIEHQHATIGAGETGRLIAIACNDHRQRGAVGMAPAETDIAMIGEQTVVVTHETQFAVDGARIVLLTLIFVAGDGIDRVGAIGERRAITTEIGAVVETANNFAALAAAGTAEQIFKDRSTIAVAYLAVGLVLGHEGQHRAAIEPIHIALLAAARHPLAIDPRAQPLKQRPFAAFDALGRLVNQGVGGRDMTAGAEQRAVAARAVARKRAELADGFGIQMGIGFAVVIAVGSKFNGRAWRCFHQSRTEFAPRRVLARPVAGGPAIEMNKGLGGARVDA